MNIKMSVDVNVVRRTISGWVSNGNVETFAYIYHKGKRLGKRGCSAFREDVLKKELHHDGFCGFSFGELEFGLRPGNIYIIEIVSGDQYFKFERLYGDLPLLLKEFVELELLPRSDLGFLQESTVSLLDSNVDIFAYKKLLIRLRRGARGKSSRYGFVGIDYKHIESDFLSFRDMTEKYIGFWLSFLDVRYLWSVNDTYADFGMTEERLAALSVSNFMHAERMFQTMRCIYDFSPRTVEQCVIERQLNYWGGMKTNRLIEDDSLDVFLSRNIDILGLVPVICRIFFEILARASREEGAGLGFNIKHSEYFSSVFAGYKSRGFM